MNAKDETHRMLDNAIEVYTDSARTFSQEEVEDAYTNLWDAIDLHAAAAVAEARAPLVEALRACHALLQDAHYEYDLLDGTSVGQMWQRSLRPPPPP